MATGDGAALLLIWHAGVERAEVAAILRRRWSAAVIGEVVAAEPSWSLFTADAAELARARRGVEPLRIVILAQRAADTSAGQRATVRESAEPFAPMPTAF